MDTTQVMFYKHVIEKENYTRLQFFLKNQALIESHAVSRFGKSSEKKKELNEARAIAKLEEKKIREMDIRQKSRQIESRTHEKAVDTSLYPEALQDPRCFDHPMRPILPSTLNILYGGESGRVKYLRERVKLTPRQKYYFPLVTSYCYGWHRPYPSKDKKYNKIGYINDTFYRKHGIELDPSWYRSPMAGTPDVCTCIYT